jgi:hypothetical protein
MADADHEERKRIQRTKVNPVLPGFGLVVGAVPFLVSRRTTHESTTSVGADGIEIRSITRKNAFDQVAVPCGAVAIALGLVGLVRGLVARKWAVLGVGVAAMALGVFQVVRGFLP